MENLPRSGLAAPGEVCFSFLERGGEFESSRLLKTAKTAVFASLVRYFYFTPPNFSILSQLFLFLSKPCSLCTKIPHQSAGFLLASRLSTKLGAADGTRTRTHFLSISMGMTRFPTHFSGLEFHQPSAVCLSVLLEPLITTGIRFAALSPL